MIEINLLPGGKKRSARGGGRSFSLPDLRQGLQGLLRRGGGRPGAGVPKVDPWMGGAAAAVILALGGMGWLMASQAGGADELEVQIEAASRDSIRFADIIARSGSLQSRRDSIATRVAVIQEIDGARYLWPHLMDEVARALPDYTWLTRFFQVTPQPQLVFRIEGRSGTYFALTSFMEGLEASPFIQGVQLLASDQVIVPTGGGLSQLVYEFVLEASGREPPAEVLMMVPLFGPSVSPPTPEAPAGLESTATQEAAPAQEAALAPQGGG